MYTSMQSQTTLKIEQLIGMEKLILLDGFIGEKTEEIIMDAWKDYLNDPDWDNSECYEALVEVVRDKILDYKENPENVNLYYEIKDAIDGCYQEYLDSYSDDYDDPSKYSVD